MLELLISLAEAPASEFVIEPAPFIGEALAKAPDHIVTYERTDRTGRKTTETITQSGGWAMRLRNGTDRTFATYAHLPNATTFVVLRDSSGRLVDLEVVRTERVRRDKRKRLTPTETFQTIAGERCRVWNVGGTTPSTDSGAIWCLTKDFIVLSSAFAGYSGTIHESMRASSVFRRSSPLKDVMPPADIFDWNAWHVTQPHQTSDRPGRAPNFRVTHERLATSRAGADDRYSLTLLGQRTRTEQTNFWGSFIDYHDGNITFSYMAEPGGRPKQLHIRVMERPWIERTYERLSNFPDQTILGESCSEFETEPVVRDGGDRQCLTKDGIPLERHTHGMGAAISATRAVKLERGTMKEDDVRPPQELMSQSFWMKAN